MRLLLPLLSLALSVQALWPIPRQLTQGTSTLLLSNSFSIVPPQGHGVPSDLSAAIALTSTQLRSDKLGRLVVGRGSSDAASFKSAKSLRRLVLSISSSSSSLKGGSISSIATEATKPIGTRDESYTLTVPSDGSDATLSANTSLGLFRGLTTFGQLWYEFSGTVYAVGTPVGIKDEPAFAYRGFMLDTARNFFPISDIKHLIDTMSMVKLNTLHWHVVDSQSFPITIPSHPELSAKGAYDSEKVYSPSDVSDLVGYANARGVDLLPEFDTPGHTSVISTSHPEHVACVQTGGYDFTFANEPPAGQLRFAVPSTSTFLLSVLQSFSSLFPTSTLFSTGGDEINAACYTQDAQTQAALSAAGETFDQALLKFTLAEHATLKTQGKTGVVWEEMVLDHNLTLSKDTVVMVWISSADAAAVAQKGYRIVHAPSDYFYLDCGGGGWLGNNVPGNSWCDPFKTWQKAYSFDPLASLTANQTSLVLGGESLLWTEQSGPENMDSIAWPRGASGAEVFWTGATLPDGTARNVQSALPRLHDIRFRMVQRGVRAINLQPLWCALRPGECDA